ncbi:phage protein Gp37 [uncultured Deefgea sp.]|uniref:phage protein Gp37 n=1 Tax=uncultured Deefgea sp. TaxID=1304914 RepID=UPI002599C561|nr:phage protein Gp37 [uncultured Deefgea sp.]
MSAPTSPAIIAQLEDKMLNALKTQLPTGGYKPLVTTYGGELDAEWAEGVRQLPAVWLFCEGGGEPTPYGTSKEKWLIPLTWSVIVATRNLRGERDARHGVQVGGHFEVGSYQLLTDVRRVLMNQDFNLAVQHLKPGRLRSLGINGGQRGMSVYAQQFHTAYIETLSKPASDLTSIKLDFVLKPGDEVVDGSDLITLRIEE